MKTTTKKTTIAAVLTIVFVSILMLTSFVAFKGPRLRSFRQNDDVIEYVKNNILPVLKEKRENFDQNLSSEEKQKVAELQQRLSALHAERMENFPQRFGQGNFNQGERPELSDAQKELIRSHMKERRQIMTDAWIIADNHESEIETILEDLKPDVEKWRDDIHEIMEPFREERQKERKEWRENRDQRRGEFRGEGFRGGHGKGSGGRGMGMSQGRGPGIFNQYSNPPMIILFDADNALERLEDIESQVITVFPNPTDGIAIIKFQLDQPEIVTVKIYDNQGNLVNSVLEERKDAGEHEVSLDVSKYDRGLYFYEIISGSLSQKGRLIKR